MKYSAIILLMLTAFTAISNSNDHDPYIWLEEVEGKKALEWVDARNAASLAVLAGTDSYREVYESSLEIMNSDDRIAAPSLRGDYIYNFWQDAENPRGVWRRTSKERYLAGEPDWDILLDIDALSETGNVPWVYRGARGLAPDYDLYIVSLSRGGADAVEMREWDIRTRSFVDGGFYLPEAKGGISWLNDSALLVWTDFGEGTMTSSGYARQVRKWYRGTPISEAKLLYEGAYEDVSTSGSVINTDDGRYAFIYRSIDFYNRHVYYLDGDTPIRLEIPSDASISGLHKKQLIVELKSDWIVNDIVFRQASLVSIDFESLIDGHHSISLIHEPGPRSSISRVAITKNHLLVSQLNNIVSELYRYTFDGNGWRAQRVNAPGMGTIRLGSTERYSDDFFFYYQN
ncbi:MAG: S9 family peptidase, partial [Bacteroidia bacterium]